MLSISFYRCWKSSLLLMVWVILVSSANNATLNWFSHQCPIIIRNNSGPRTVPWETALMTLEPLEHSLSTMTDYSGLPNFLVSIIFLCRSHIPAAYHSVLLLSFFCILSNHLHTGRFMSCSLHILANLLQWSKKEWSNYCSMHDVFSSVPSQSNGAKKLHITSCMITWRFVNS